jgi:hypothetical protein
LGACGDFFCNQLALIAGDDDPDAAAGFMDMTLVARDVVDIGMENDLTGGGMDIDTHIESVGDELALEDGYLPHGGRVRPFFEK